MLFRSQAQLRSDNQLAQQTRDSIESMLEATDKNPAAREALFGGDIEALRKKQRTLDPGDPAQLKEMRLNEAKIASMVKFRDSSRSMIDAERRQQENLLGPLHKRQLIEANIVKLQKRKKEATNEERVEIDRQVQSLEFQKKAASMAAVEQELALGLGGADARRSAFREMRRERRELARMARVQRPGVQDARAFTRQLMSRDRALEISQAAIRALNKPMEDVNQTLKDRLKPTKLG